MRKIILYGATSLDGFIAGPNHELDWLDELPNLDKVDHGYYQFITGVDTLIMGRKTYEVIKGFEWPYEQETYVMTRNNNLEVWSPKTQLMTNFPESIEKLQNQEGKNIWLVGGGKLVTEFLNHDLLDEMIISVIPVVLGKGIPLLPDHPKKTWFTLASSETYDTGAVNLHYIRQAPDHQD